MSSIFSIGRSALSAAQAGLATTGNNIANTATPGYSRQSIVQKAAPGQNRGYGVVGGGTLVTDIRRSYSDLLAARVNSSQSIANSTASYSAQITQIDNVMSSSTAGVSSALQDFFSGLQNLTANPQSASNRQALISASDSLSSSFQNLNSQLADSRTSVNTQIAASTDTINAYANQIAALNVSIKQASASGHTPNDLMDQRDVAVTSLSKQVSVSITKDGASYNISVGNGQPLVLGASALKLVPQVSSSDSNRMGVAYQSGNAITSLSENSLSGGTLGGLFDYRSKSLDNAQNELGRIAIVMADAINAQHHLGLDQTGQPGGDVFYKASPVVTANSRNQTNAVINASIITAHDLTGSDYRMQYDGSSYTVTQLSNNKKTTLTSVPQTIDGVSFGIASGSPVKGDSFLIQPTIDGAAKFSNLIISVKQIATASPVSTAVTLTNTGSGSISSAAIDKSYLNSPLASSFTLQFTAGTTSGSGTLSGFPNGSTSSYFAGIPITYKGVTFTLSGSPATGDTFSISPNTNGGGSGNNTNLLAAIQNTKTVGGSLSIQSAYASLVSTVGNKTRELGVLQAADVANTASATTAQQSESGVNLDEEAANLLKYQQAYQAAGKLMQTAGTFFDTLLSIMR
jgi:flagellar hook-associated protein 1 FlgK